MILKVDESNVQMQECYQCGTPVPLMTLRSHLTSCEEAPPMVMQCSTDVQETPRIDVKVCGLNIHNIALILIIVRNGYMC